MIKFRTLIFTQSLYIFITALWPLVHIDSFMWVTGDKTDTWLVKTVGALLIPIAITLGMYLLIPMDKRPALILGALTAVAFCCIDFYYALSDVISDVYLLDAVIEIVFLLSWTYLAFRRYNKYKKKINRLRAGNMSRFHTPQY